MSGKEQHERNQQIKITSVRMDPRFLEAGARLMERAVAESDARWCSLLIDAGCPDIVEDYRAGRIDGDEAVRRYAAFERRKTVRCLLWCGAAFCVVLALTTAAVRIWG